MVNSYKKKFLVENYFTDCVYLILWFKTNAPDKKINSFNHGRIIIDVLSI